MPCGEGSHCNADVQACCDSNGDCTELEALCCEAQGGVPAGSGTACSDYGEAICTVGWACCHPDPPDPDYCENHEVYACVVDYEGTVHVGLTCDSAGDTDGDGVIDACDNCPDTDNGPDAGTCSEGLVGAACMIDPDCDVDPGDGVCSTAQEDADEDGVGDVCDNCPNEPNPGQGDDDEDGVGDVCDNCPNDYNPDQEDCDGNGVGDVCDTDCDGDGITDACDDDDDNDGVPDDDDVCDHTPATAIGVDPEDGGVITAEDHRLRGTVFGDVDGDCDRDENDLGVLFDTEASCDDGVPDFDENCPECNCPACNSCCPPCSRF
jgi:hypothetical protein